MLFTCMFCAGFATALCIGAGIGQGIGLWYPNVLEGESLMAWYATLWVGTAVPTPMVVALLGLCQGVFRRFRRAV